jgi:cytochrome c peroxidase
VTFSLSAACSACHGFSATTPTKFFLTTTFTEPGMPSTELSSTLISVAPAAGGRTTRPCSMPGTRTL